MSGQRKKLCFIIMPFKDDLKDVYHKAIKPACLETGFRALRVDELKGPFNIHRKIIQNIFLSEIMIADLTGWNPNVFYEMGVAHAIENKTIMISNEGENLPFDVNAFNCILYRQDKNGLEKLKTQLIDSINHFDAWRQEPSNPVQDFKPHDAFVPQGELDQLQTELREKNSLIKQLKSRLLKQEKQIKNSVAKEIFRKLEGENKTLQTQLKKAAADTARLKALEKDIAAKTAEIETLRQQTTHPARKEPRKITAAIQLRAEPQKELTGEAVKKMLRQYDFYCGEYDWSKDWANPGGNGIQHQYELAENGKVVVDKTTGLTWQQGGSENYMVYKDAEKYIQQLNRERFAGFDDWRLPTLEEAMSLMESKKLSGDYYIDHLFGQKQYYIWTSDYFDASRAWVVYFGNGYCNLDDVGDVDYVRAVR